MTSTDVEFSSEMVLKSVAKELQVSANDLVLSWDETVVPLRKYALEGRTNHMKLLVYHNQLVRDLEACKEICTSLLSGRFFDDNEVTKWMVEAVAKVCNLSDLTPYLTVLSREGWVMPIDEEKIVSLVKVAAKTISDLKKNQAERLAMWLADPMAALWSIHKGDLSAVMSVLIEQCWFDVGALLNAVKSTRLFSDVGRVYISAITPEGFVIEADNREGAVYLEKMYDAERSEQPRL